MPISNLKINTHIGVAYSATAAKIGEGEFGGGATETRTFSSTNNISPPVTSSVNPTLGISGSNPYQPIEGVMAKPIPASTSTLALDTFNYPNYNPDGSLTNNYDTFSPYSYVKLEGMISPTTTTDDAEDDISFFRMDFPTNFLPNFQSTICRSYPSSIETYVGYISVNNNSYMYWFSEDYNV